MKKNKKVAIIMFVSATIVICIVFITKYYMDLKYAEENIYTISTYMADVNVLDKFEENNMHYASIEITSDDVIKAYKLTNNKLTLKIDENIYDDIIINKSSPYIGISMVLDLNINDVTKEEFARIKSNKVNALSYDVYYEFFTISKLHLGE